MDREKKTKQQPNVSYLMIQWKNGNSINRMVIKRIVWGKEKGREGEEEGNVRSNGGRGKGEKKGRRDGEKRGKRGKKVEKTVKAGG